MRVSEWEQQLNDYLAGVADEAHAYGKHDCMMFVAGAIKAQTGNDHARGHRGKYKTAEGARKYLEKLGFKTPVGFLNDLLEKKPVAFAHRGDIVAGKDGIPGVCVGADALFVGMSNDTEGLVRVPRSEWTRAWGV